MCKMHRLEYTLYEFVQQPSMQTYDLCHFLFCVDYVPIQTRNKVVQKNNLSKILACP